MLKPFLKTISTLSITAITAITLLSPLTAKAEIDWQSSNNAPYANATNQATSLSLTERIAVTERIENYLNSITTMKADFFQWTNDGYEAEGLFQMERPGNLRFDYSRDGLTTRNYQRQNWTFLLVTGEYVHFYDYESNQQNRTRVEEELVNFFTRDPISLTEGVEISEVSRLGTMLAITLIPQADNQSNQYYSDANLTLYFRENPMELAGYAVDDGTGSLINIRFYNAQQGIPLDTETLFQFRTPDPIEYRDNR